MAETRYGEVQGRKGSRIRDMLVILLVIRKASENLIPVSLEPGGKNPCVVVTDAITATGLRHAVGGGAVGI